MLGGAFALPEITAVWAQHQGVEPGTDLELEAKFGSYSGGGGFTSAVTWTEFDRLRRALRNQSAESLVRFMDHKQGDFRKRHIRAQTPEGQEEILWQTKTRIRSWENPDYNVRLSLNREHTLTPDEIPKVFTPTVLREGTRYSYLLAGGAARADLTDVNMDVAGSPSRTIYEVELEFLGPSVNELPAFLRTIETLFKWLHDTLDLYTVLETERLVNDVNRLLGGRMGHRVDGRLALDRGIVVDARNLKLRDMVWGGLVGNPQTIYTVTHKTDGVRKLLVFHQSGIWLVFPPLEFNLIRRLEIKALAGTIWEGESVPLDRRRTGNGAPKSLVWFLVFDCLASQNNTGVQNQPHGDRMRLVEPFSQKIAWQELTTSTKSFASVDTPEKFYSSMREYLRNRELLPYQEDGLIFTPESPPYNPHSDRKCLIDRVLTRYPDVVKWKPKEQISIDFKIVWEATPEGVPKIQLLVGGYRDDQGQTFFRCDPKARGLRMQDVPFVGSTIIPLNDRIDMKHPMTTPTNTPTRTIIEYAWDFDRELLVPLRVRPDKTNPNSEDVALDNWDDIHNPIDEETLEGKNFKMVFRYHNRIKKGLLGGVGGGTLLDIGSGMGGDVAKWKGFDKVIAVEPNEEYRVELIRRIQLQGMEGRVVIVPTAGEDYKTISEVVTREIPGGKVDTISLMLSLTFFWESSLKLDGLTQTLIRNLKPTGAILFLTMDGDTTEQLFQPAFGGPTYDKMKLGPAEIIYTPRHLLKIAPGQGTPLTIHIPDSIVTHQTEYLVYLTDLETRLRPYGIILQEAHRAETERFLTAEEKLYSSLFTFGTWHHTEMENLPPIKYPSPQMARAMVPTVGTSPKSPLIRPLIAAERPPEFISPPLGERLPIPLAGPVGSPVRTFVTLPTLPGFPGSPTRGMVPQIPPAPTVPTLNQLGLIPPQPSQNPPTLTAALQNAPTGGGGELVLTGVPPKAPTSPATLAKRNCDNAGQNQLPGLHVIPPRNVTLPATNDDTYEPLACTWFKNVARVATIGDGNCFIHAVVKAFYPPYQENGSYGWRTDFARKLRRDLAAALPLDDARYTTVETLPDGEEKVISRTYWETAANGAFVRLLMQQLVDPALINVIGLDYSLRGLQALFNSTAFLGDEVYQYVSDMLDLDIYIVRVTSQEVCSHSSTSHVENEMERKRLLRLLEEKKLNPHEEDPNYYRELDKLRNSIVICGNTQHYEVVATDDGKYFSTVYRPDDTFLEALRKFYEGGVEEKYNPDASFISAASEIFTNSETGKLEIPNAEGILGADDPFVVTLKRLRSFITARAIVPRAAVAPLPAVAPPVVPLIVPTLREMPLIPILPTIPTIPLVPTLPQGPRLSRYSDMGTEELRNIAQARGLYLAPEAPREEIIRALDANVLPR